MKQNCALLSKGCFIAEESKPANIFSSAERLLCDCDISWCSPASPAPYCILDFSKVEGKPPSFNTIAFYNSTCSFSCPSLIEVYYRPKVGEKWGKLGEFQLQRYAGWQSFTFKPIPQTEMTLVYVKLLENFGGKEIRLTQLSLSFERKQGEMTELRKELLEVKAENKQMKQRLAEQERDYTKMKEIILKMEKQLRFMIEETESESTDELAKLNYAREEQSPHKTIEILIEEEASRKESFELLE